MARPAGRRVSDPQRRREFSRPSGDTRTPIWSPSRRSAVKCAFEDQALPSRASAPPGLALATAAGAWINLVALLYLGLRRYLFQPDDTLKSVTAPPVATASVVLANIALWLQAPFAALGGRGVLGGLIALACFGLVCLIVYGGALVGGAKALGVDPAQLGLAKFSRVFRRK